MAFEINFLDIPMILATVVGFYSFIRMWRYIAGELKTAPKESFSDRISNFLSGSIFVAIATIAISFIFTLILSSIAINTIFAIQERKFVYIDAMAKPWQFQTFIPVALLSLVIFAFSYTFIEFLQLSKRSQEGPMEIQQWIETKAINRFNPPWSFFSSIFFFILIILIPSIVISLIAKSLNIFESFDIDFQKNTGYAFIFIVFIMLGPIFYLSYYSTYGNCQVLFQGSRILKSRKFLKKGKNWLLIFFSFIALVSAISSCYSLYQNIPIFWGEYPDLTTSYTDLGEGFVENILNGILKQIPNISQEDLDGLAYFTSIVPIDFILFFITTIGFGLKGFSSDFLAKEPLNRPQVVLFATYIFSGIAFQIFLNILVTWPWILPEDYIFITLELSDPQFQSIIMFFFAPAVAIESIFTLGFLIYNLFFNKNLKKQIDYNLLNEAILENNVDILKIYSRNKNPQIRLMVVNALKDLIQTSDDEDVIKSLVSIMQEMIFDEDASVFNNVFELFESQFPTSPPLTFLPVFLNIIQDTADNSRVFDKYSKAVIETGKEDPKKIEQLIPELLEKKISSAGSDFLVKIVREISRKHNEFPLNTCIPLIESKNPNFIETGLEVISQVVGGFSKQYDDLYTRCLNFFNSSNPEIKKNALNVIGGIISHKRSFIDRFLDDLNHLYNSKSPQDIKIQLIGIIVQGITVHPDTFDKLFPILVPFMSDDDSVIRGDMALAIGSLGINITHSEYFARIHPKVQLLSKDSNLEVKQNILRSLVMIGKVRKNIIGEGDFLSLFFQLLLEVDKDSRLLILEFFEGINFTLLINKFEVLLQNNLNPEIIVEILSYFTVIIPEVYKIFDQSPIIQTLLEIFENHPTKIESYVKFFTTLSRYSILGYLQVHVFLKDALDYDNGEIHASNIILRGYYAKKISKIREEGENINSVIRLPQNFPPIDHIIIEEIKSKKKMLLESLDLAQIFPYLKNELKHKSVITVRSVLMCYEDLFQTIPTIHKEVYPILLSLRNQRDSVVVTYLTKLFLQFALSYPNDYLSEKKKGAHNDPILTGNWKKEIMPFLIENISISDEGTLEPLKEVFSILSKRSKEKSALLSFLFEGLYKNKVSSYRLICFHSILSLEDIFLNKKIQKSLLKLSKDNDIEIRKAVINEIGKKLIYQMEICKNDTKEDKKHQKSVVKILKNFLEQEFITDEVSAIRLISLNNAILLLKFNFFTEKILYQVKIATADEEESIAQLAVQTFFNYLRNNSVKVNLIHKIYYFTELKKNNVKLNVIEQILNLYLYSKDESSIISSIPGLIEAMYPTIFTFAKDSSSEVRRGAYNLLRSIFSDDPIRVITAYPKLVKLLNHRNISIQSDCLACISLIFVEKFPFLKEKSKNLYLLRLYQRFCRSKHYEILSLIASNLQSLVKFYPQKINQILGIIYYLLKVNDHHILQNCFDVFDDIIGSDSMKKSQIKKNTEKVYQKGNNLFIGQYLEKLKDKGKKHELEKTD